MRLLVDTHVLLWVVADPDRIPPRARDQLESPDNEVLFSAASIWELAIKMQIGKLSLASTPEEIAMTAEGMGFIELPVTSAHAAAVRNLPRHHRDPFDRLLLAQAMVEPARFFTVDANLRRYSDLVELLTQGPVRE